MDRSSNPGNFKTVIFADCLANSKEIFRLIGEIFPVESCQQYGVLPLKLASSNLTIGMLDPHDEESLKFVNSIARVFRYRLEIQHLDRQTLQIMLDSYPQASRSQKPELDRDRTIVDRTIIDRSFDPDSDTDRRILRRRQLADSAPTIISQPDELSSPQFTTNSGGLSDLPPDLDFLQDLDLSPSPAKPDRTPADSAATLYEIPPEFRDRQNNRDLDDKPTIIGGNPAELMAQVDLTSEDGSDAVDEARSQLIAETTRNATNRAKANRTEDYLPELMPQLSWRKLLERAFEYQTNCIHLNFQADCGSIVAEKNGSVQSTVKQVPLPIFCSAIDEIKRMARIPHNTSSHPRKVVLERFYQQERILLRIEFVSQEPLAKVNVQILRDRALRVYEQQQMDKAGEQALQLAQQLEKTLRRLKACSDSVKPTNLRELQKIQRKIDHQLKMLDK